MGRRLEEERMNLPITEDLDGCNYKPLPYYLLGDEIFPLKPWLMRPFPGKNMTEEERVYNYRQSRGRRTIENTFGILVTRWRIFLTPIRASVRNVEKYVLACLSLHNYLMQTDNTMYIPTGFIDSENRDGTILPGEWRNQMAGHDVKTGCIRSTRPLRGYRYREDCATILRCI